MTLPPRRRHAPAELRNALIRQARHLIEGDVHDEEGTGAYRLSIRAVARAAGVSEAAPYTHFPGGVTELLAAVALEGFVELMAAIQQPADKESRAAALALTMQYVRFGVQRAALYRTMFHAQLATPLSAALAAEEAASLPGIETYASLAGQKAAAFECFLGVTSRLPRRPGRSRSRTDDAFALASLAHGLVGVYIDEGLGREGTTAWTRTRASAAKHSISAMIRGLV